MPGDDLVIAANSTANSDPFTMADAIRAAFDAALTAAD